MELTGKVHEVSGVIVVSEKFKKIELVVEYAENPSYPEYIKLEAPNDHTSKLDDIKIGDNVTVHFNLRGRPWTDKAGKTSYFNTLSIWKISKNSAAPVAEPVDSNPPF